MEKNSFKKRKVVLVGTGMVGMSYAYSILNSNNVCDELVLIDKNKEKAMGEVLDLNHSLAFSGYNIKIYAGDYSDCADADVVTICAGIPRKPGDSRLDLLNNNVEIFKSVVGSVMESGFDGCFLIATNPVDVMTYVTQKISGLPAGRVIGSGTTLDTSRLRYLLSERFLVSPKNVHAYVLGEHGDSSFIPWSQATIGASSVKYFCQHHPELVKDFNADGVLDEVRRVAAEVIKAKKATYYSIGLVLRRITTAILSNENTILTLSANPTGKYGYKDLCIGLPSVVGRNGIVEVMELDLNSEETEKLAQSCNIIGDLCGKVNI